MRDLSQFVSEDSRSPMERMRRAQLWKVADALGLQYPPGAPKTTMVALLTANGVDVTQPIAGIQWRMSYGKNSDGMPTQELYPVVPEHASARNGVNATLIVDQRIAAQQTQVQKQDDKFQESRIKALEDENARLQEIIDKRLAALEHKEAEPQRSGPNASQREYWKAYRQAKGMNLPVQRGMTREQIETLIREAQS